MQLPDYYSDAPSITLYDPLADFLGASQEGLLTYTYADAVQLAGHSCPTVAGAYLMTVKALKHLYGDEVPERGGVRVFFPDNIQEGVTGVMANVITLLLGATNDTGFKGLAGRFDRRNLLFSGEGFEGDIAFERVDTGQRVTVTYHARAVPPAAEMMPALQNAINAPLGSPESREFLVYWHDRVRRIFEYADDARLISLQ